MGNDHKEFKKLVVKKPNPKRLEFLHSVCSIVDEK